jgi:hypothetical protein
MMAQMQIDGRKVDTLGSDELHLILEKRPDLESALKAARLYLTSDGRLVGTPQEHPACPTPPPTPSKKSDRVLPGKSGA